MKGASIKFFLSNFRNTFFNTISFALMIILYLFYIIKPGFRSLEGQG